VLAACGYDGTDYSVVGEIRFLADANVADGDSPGSIQFRTTNNAAQVSSVRATLAEGGLTVEDDIFLPNDASVINWGAGDITCTYDSTLQELKFAGGAYEFDHTATEADDHCIEIVHNAAGFGDSEAIDIDYITGALASGDEEAIILVNVDDDAATGGEVVGFEMLVIPGALDRIFGLKVGALIGPIDQSSGTFGNATTFLNIAADELTEVSSAGAPRSAVFVADNDTITIGGTAKFEEISFVLFAVASSGGIAPTFEFSTGGTGFTAFSPIDGTNGFRNSGVMAWDDLDIPSWATNATGEFEIRITRTRNAAGAGTAVIDVLQIATTVDFKWDLLGNIWANSRYLMEQDAAAADDSSFGQLWVKTTDPNTLWYTDGEGADLKVVLPGDGVHDGFSDFVGNEHINWVDGTATNFVTTGTLGAGAATVAALVATTIDLGDGGAICTVILDEDAMGTNSATALATQQSIKAYVDSFASAADVRYDVAGEFTKPQGCTEQAVTGTTTLVMDFALGNYFEHTLTDNTTFSATNLTIPGTYVLKLTQHASSPKTVAWNSVVLWPAGTDPVMTATNGAVDIYSFLVDSAGVIYGTFVQAMAA
jgi:hypothetical protein